MAVLFLRTIVCIVALTILMVIPASAQSGPIQQTGRSDENCIPKPAEFSIAVGYFAEKFTLVSLSAGRSCDPRRAPLTHKAFQIRNVRSNGSETPVFNYGQDEGRPPVVDVPGGLAALKLPAGRYRLYVNGARDNSVVISYFVSAGDVAPPPPKKIGSEKSVQVQCAKDGRCTAISFSDNKCARTTALFTVPAGKIAADFQYVRLTSGQNCETNMELSEKGFQITALVGSAPEAQRFKFHQSGSNPPSQTPVSLAQLQLRPGTYKVRVDGAKSNVVELRFAIKAGYAKDDHTGHLPPKPAKIIACHNDGKNFTAQSFADDRCVLTACSFTVPANRLAVQFKVQSLTPGSGCYTGMPSETAGFQIVRSGTQQILYNYIGVVTPNPAGLSALNLRPGNYLLQTSVARNSGVSLTFMIENPFEAAPETSRQPATSPVASAPSGSAAPLAGVWAVNFNSWGGTLTVNPNGSATLNQGSGLETLTDVRYDAASGRITFTRMLPNSGPQHKQVYTGRLTREGHAEGTFDCTLSGKGFPWKIERTSKAAVVAPSR